MKSSVKTHLQCQQKNSWCMFFKYSYIFMIVSFHIAVGLMWCDVMWCDVCVCVNKRDVENETEEIAVEN